MAKEVVWTHKALQDRINIYNYWKQRNQNDAYSHKIENLLGKVIELLAKYPLAGRKVDFPNVRVKSVLIFKVFYLIEVNRLVVLRVWDSRQDPESIII